MFTYYLHIEPQEEGGYIVSIPLLPGCATEGETLEECLENIEDAAKGYLYVLHKHGKNIPVNFGDQKSVTIKAKDFLNA